ncbi:MAG: twin-arginine translocase TatA/TatE family subunit [Acidaminococcus sp.]|jgi:sec-independent protein translocase protein TatA|nr:MULTISPECIES: twin-arginine translocase TatA/TatE family subunit [Acidaminococcus]MDD6570470.1 twin-arginine translocase TatA/TatE family subunit [Acidaminococcus sp.]MDO5598277.1 twin-arginine translocase TatA/TatE family subunit [Acidaminococcus sp.]MEE0338467.1 twin-arginine translocase TatA/TatE family subunit [Acidaminococcus fermentans]UEA72468.1 twin-arginine translocase TatA/TatE family subunit [Acidaminococcus fermentans DSM 20731]
MMFGLGVPELMMILIIGLIVFGPGKLPTIGSALGKSIREFKEAFYAPVESREKEGGKDGKPDAKQD